MSWTNCQKDVMDTTFHHHLNPLSISLRIAMQFGCSCGCPYVVDSSSGIGIHHGHFGGIGFAAVGGKGFVNPLPGFQVPSQGCQTYQMPLRPQMPLPPQSQTPEQPIMLFNWGHQQVMGQSQRQDLFQPLGQILFLVCFKKGLMTVLW